MLLFALFTLGYFFGVVLTLSLLTKKEALSGAKVANKLTISEMNEMDSWEIHEKLVAVNDKMGYKGLGIEKIKSRLALPGRISFAGFPRER